MKIYFFLISYFLHRPLFDFLVKGIFLFLQKLILKMKILLFKKKSPPPLGEKASVIPSNS